MIDTKEKTIVKRSSKTIIEVKKIPIKQEKLKKLD